MSELMSGAQGRGQVVEPLPDMHEALDAIPTPHTHTHTHTHKITWLKEGQNLLL
jgi:hypothetical protein